MKNDWWFKFQYSKWDDPELRLCTLETQGFWLRIYTHLRRQGKPTITASIEDLARIAGGTAKEVRRSVMDLKDHNAADVTLCNTQNVTCNSRVTLTSRSLIKEISTKEKTRLRVQRHRSNTDVTLKKQPHSKSKSKSNKKEKKKSATPPAIEAVRSVCNLYPPKVTWETIEQAIGDEPDQNRLAKCFKAWSLKGNKPTNYAWATEWYVQGIPTQGRKPTPTGNNYDPKKDLLSPDFEMPPAQRETFKESADFCLGDQPHRYEEMKANWLLRPQSKGYEHEVEEYERTSSRYQRFIETRQNGTNASADAGRG